MVRLALALREPRDFDKSGQPQFFDSFAIRWIGRAVDRCGEVTHRQSNHAVIKPIKAPRDGQQCSDRARREDLQSSVDNVMG